MNSCVNVFPDRTSGSLKGRYLECSLASSIWHLLLAVKLGSASVQRPVGLFTETRRAVSSIGISCKLDAARIAITLNLVSADPKVHEEKKSTFLYICALVYSISLSCHCTLSLGESGNPSV